MVFVWFHIEIPRSGPRKKKDSHHDFTIWNGGFHTFMWRKIHSHAKIWDHVCPLTFDRFHVFTQEKLRFHVSRNFVLFWWKTFQIIISSPLDKSDANYVIINVQATTYLPRYKTPGIKKLKLSDIHFYWLQCWNNWTLVCFDQHSNLYFLCYTWCNMSISF